MIRTDGINSGVCIAATTPFVSLPYRVEDSFGREIPLPDSAPSDGDTLLDWLMSYMHSLATAVHGRGGLNIKWYLAGKVTRPQAKKVITVGLSS